MPSAIDPGREIGDLDARMRRDRGLDLRIADVAASLSDLPPQQAIENARNALIGRVADLQAALSDVSATIQRLEDLARVVRFTDEGWPARRDELLGELSTDPSGGLAGWLSDWFIAVAARRVAALDRLMSLKDALPPGSQVLFRRCQATTSALEQGTWGVAVPLLIRGARGIPIVGDVIPDSDTRRDLWVLLVRFALRLGRDDDARALLDEAIGAGSQPILQALTLRLEWSDAGPAPADLMSKAAGSPDAAAEIARLISLTAGSSRSPDLRLDAASTAARTAVAAARTLNDANQQVLRLLDPVPAELHFALGERARREGNADIAVTSFESAAAAAENLAVRAEAHLQLSEMAMEAGDARRRRDELLAAAVAWGDAGQGDRSAAIAEDLLARDPRNEDPRNAEVRCQLASAHIMLASNTTSAAERASHYHLALDVAGPVAGLLEITTPEGADRAWLSSWAAWNESYAHQGLSELDGEEQANHRWLALDAAARAVQWQPAHASMWAAVDDSAFVLKLWALSELAAAQAAAFDSTRDRVARHAATLANLGEFDRSLEVLGQPEGAFEANMRAHVLLRLGRADEALAAFREQPPEPAWPWAGSSYVSAVVLADSYEQAVTAAKELDATLRSRRSETAIQIIVAYLSLVMSDDRRVESLQAELLAKGEHSADFALAAVRTAQNRPDEAHALFLSGVREFTTLDEVDSWEQIDKPTTIAVLRARGVRPPDLTEVDKEVAIVREALIRRRDVRLEIADTSDDVADPTTMDAAKVRALELVDLGESAAERTSLQDSALDVVESIPAATDPGPVVISLVCPASWFAGVDSPTEQHEMFLRALPELRLTSAAPIPSLTVSVDDSLEPDGYRIQVADVVLGSGTVPLTTRLLPQSALALLPAGSVPATSTTGSGHPAAEPGFVSVVGGDPFVDALSEPTLDVLMRRLEEAVTTHPDEVAP